MGTKVDDPVQSCPNKATDEIKQDPKKHFINFKIVDDAGMPVENVVLHVFLPDGSSEEKISDKNGMIEIKNIDPGNCRIESEWKEVKAKHILISH